MTSSTYAENGKTIAGYTIGDKGYTQKPLVLGQWKQLLDQIKGIAIPADIDALGLANLLGDQLPLVLAVLLNPDGVSLKGKDLPALADELEFSLEAEDIIRIIDDFFVCNPLPSILARMSQAAESIGKKMKATPLTASSSPLQPETSPVETTSSGDILQTSASPG